MPTILRAQKEHRESLIDQFRVITSDVEKGNLDRAIHYINQATIKTDVENLLHRKLKGEEAKQLLLAPSHIVCQKLARAAYAARELQGMRSMTRRYLQNTHGRLHAQEIRELQTMIERAERVLSDHERRDEE